MTEGELEFKPFQMQEKHRLATLLVKATTHQQFNEVLRKINHFDSVLATERYNRFGSSHIMRMKP